MAKSIDFSRPRPWAPTGGNKNQINKNRLEINNFGGAHGKNLDLRVHTVGAHGRGQLKSIDLAVCTLKSIKITQINKNGRN